MNSQEEMLLVSGSPHIHRRRTTRRCMLHVIVALVPALATAVWVFGWPALRVMTVAVAVAVAAEWAIGRWMTGGGGRSVTDLSAVVTGLLLAATLPSSLPWWMVAVGALVSVGVVKMAFGGLGCNIFNPALAGRVFLLLSFPAAMTTWPLPGAEGIDGATGATLLTAFNEGTLTSVDTVALWTGRMGGSLGEVGALALLAGMVYLLAVRVITWHIPVAIIATVALFDACMGVNVLTDLLTGGLLLGAIFMATDYVTSPMTRTGQLVYGAMIGLITVVIRRWGAYPEGISFAIMLMNGVTPLIDRAIRPSRPGARGRRWLLQ